MDVSARCYCFGISTSRYTFTHEIDLFRYGGVVTVALNEFRLFYLCINSQHQT